jgi:hypothetical protein
LGIGDALLLRVTRFLESLTMSLPYTYLHVLARIGRRTACARLAPLPSISSSYGGMYTGSAEVVTWFVAKSGNTYAARVIAEPSSPSASSL